MASLCIININCCTRSSSRFFSGVSFSTVVSYVHSFPTSTVNRKFVLGRDDSGIITISHCCKFIHERNLLKYGPETTVL
jgi:hypothetical protein